MNLTDKIINAALLGSAAKELPIADFPQEVQETFREIQEKSDDAEAAFFQMSALGLAYQRAGMEVRTLTETVPVVEASEEERLYFNREVGDLLTLLHTNRHRNLLLYAYRKAVACGKLIPPYFLPVLLNRAFDRTNPDKNEEQRFLAELTGNRGRWLLKQMGLPVWGKAGEETWETASHEERKRMLSDMRKTNPEEGLALLQTELKKESAAHREELINCLRINLSKKDEPFLSDIVATDRSSSVRETGLKLLCCLPNSQLVESYCELLRGKLRYNLLLGWSYDKVAFTPEMKKLGLEEVSPNKNEKDDRFLLRQLAERVPLNFWSELYDCTAEKAAARLAKNPPFQKLFQLSRPILNFNDSQWAYYTLKENADENLIIDLSCLLTPAQREEISYQSRGKGMINVPSTWFNTDEPVWGIKFSLYALQCILWSNTYFPKETAELLALYFPQEMRQKVAERVVAETEPDSYPVRICRQLMDYMDLKQRIDTLLNDNK